LDVLADAYATAPISIALIGSTSHEQRHLVRVLFELRLPTMSGTRLVVVRSGSVIGFAHWILHTPGHASLERPPSIAPALLAALPDGVLPRLVTFLHEWRLHDLNTPHSHLGPIAVAPSHQGGGIGRMLMGRFCSDLEYRDEVAYLETDRPANVAFFRNFGFEVVSETQVLGVQNWLMTRVPGQH